MSTNSKSLNPGHPPDAQDDLGRVPQRDRVTKFWVLAEPETAEAERRRARWNKKDGLDYETISCPIDPMSHRRAGRRITPLSVTLPNREPVEFIWTAFECMIQESVLQFLGDAGFTGYEVIPARARFTASGRQPPKLWELRAKGSAGLISPESGYKVLSICPGCGLIDDGAKIADPTKVVDESKWGGTDFFRVQPISGWMFVTNRVVEALSKTNFRGWAAYSLAEMKESFDIAVPGPM